jgi:hypothetical protein
MATFKAVVCKYRKNDGTYNVKIRVIHQRLVRLLSTNLFLTREDLTRSLKKIKKPEYFEVADAIVRKCRQCCNLHAADLGGMDNVVALVSDIVRGRESRASSSSGFELDIISYGRSYVQQLRASEHEGTAQAYDVALNSLERFLGRQSLSIHEVTSRLMKDWIAWLQNHAAQGSKGRGRAESQYPSSIRALHNRARREFNDEDVGNIRIPLLPFKNIKLPPMPCKRERALDVEDVRKIFCLPYDTKKSRRGNNRFNFAKDLFMLSFGLVGMNAVDLFYCADYKDGRITYFRKKVASRRADMAKISIKVEPEIKALVDKYRDSDGKRVFCFYKMYSNANAFSFAINGKKCKDDNGKLTCCGLTHIAPHQVGKWW